MNKLYQQQFTTSNGIITALSIFRCHYAREQHLLNWKSVYFQHRYCVKVLLLNL